MARAPRPAWFAYVLISQASAERTRSYVGVAIDVDRRARQHNGELAGGARSTRVGRPWKVARVYGPFADRGAAQVIEHQLKRRRGAAARLAVLRGVTRVPRSARSRTGC
ncbi:MAG: GIY-YIG nuclease family protein [Kofleriaceae bacterium]